MFSIQLHSEWRKAKTSLYWWALGLSSIAVYVLVSSFFLFAGLYIERSPIDVSDSRSISMLLTVGVSFAFLLPLIFGLLIVSMDFHDNTIFYSFLGSSSRWSLFWAKIAICALSGAVFSLIAALVSLATMWGFVELSEHEVKIVSPEILISALLIVVVSTLLSVLGGAFGALITKPLLAVLGIILWTQVAEPIMRIVAPTWLQNMLPSVVVDSSLGETFLAVAFVSAVIPQSRALVMLLVGALVLSLVAGWRYSKIEL